jgi:hypothetical protein
LNTVERLISKLMQAGQVKPARYYYEHVRPWRPRVFAYHAQRSRREMTAKKIGDLIQIDHMSVTLKAGFQVNELRATRPITGIH